MSAREWTRLKSFHSAPPCAGGCMKGNGNVKAKSRGVGAFRLEINGWPAGYWCAHCRREMDAAWDSALESADVPMLEAAAA